MSKQTPQEEIILDKNNPDSIYKWLCFKITSPIFRLLIKDFIDDNCSCFIDVDENTFQQGQLFNEFTQLIENLLNDLLIEGGLSQEQFLAAAERGLEDQKYKKYFDQIINFSDYNYFKSLMTKRNYNLIKKVEEQMEKSKKEKEIKEQEEIERQLKIENQKKGGKKTDREIEEEKNRMLLNQLLHKEEEEELQKAIQQSMQIEDEKKRIEIIEDEELKRAIKQSLLDSVRPVEDNNKKDDKPKEKEKEKKQETKKEEKKPEPKKEVFSIEKNNTFNFESKETPTQNMNTPIETKVEKPKPNFVISSSKGSEFQIEGKKKEIDNPINNKKNTEFKIDSGKTDLEFNAPAPVNFNPYARPPAYQQKYNVKIENSHITQELIDDTEKEKKPKKPKKVEKEIIEKKDYTPTLIEIEKKNKNENVDNNKNKIEIKNENKNDNKKSFNLLQFDDNQKEENIIVAKEIKTEKASDIIKNTLNQINQININEKKDDGENDDGDGLLIDDDEEDVKVNNNNININEPKTNTFIDKKKDINLGKVRIGKDGGNFLNNFTGMKNYEKGGFEKMENKMKETQFKSVIDTQNDDDDYQSKLREVENEKQAKLREYREYLLKMKKEKRENKAKEVLTPEELSKLESKKRLAEQLKAKRK